MKQSVMKRLEHVEARQVMALRLEDQRSKWSATLHAAMLVGNALQRGVNAREELDAADASLKPDRRAELEEQLAAARSIASALETGASRRETPLSARTIIPGSLDALLGGNLERE